MTGDEQREALADALRRDVVGCVCVPDWCLHAVQARRDADALLASPAMARLLADAERRGAARGWEEGWRLGVERKPGRNPYRAALTHAAAQDPA